MIAELSQTFALLKTASDLVKGFTSVQNKIAIGDIKVKLNNIILDLQANASSLQEKYNEIVNSKNELEKKVGELKNYKSEKEKYILKEITTGIIAYVPKKEKDRISKNHWLCQNCLDNSKKFSIYQRHNDNYFSCPHCGNRIFPDSDKNNPEVRFTV